MRRKSVNWWKSELGITKKSDVESRIREIVASYPDGQGLTSIDQNIVLTVLKHHYQYQSKVCCDLKHIEIRTNFDEYMPTRGFWIVRTDGSSIDISWPTAMQPSGRPTPQQDVSYSARFEIKKQIDEFRKTSSCDQCPLCDRDMTRGSNLHVDHEIPFKQLLADFLHSKSLTYTQVEIEDLGLHSRFKDRDLSEVWKNYHRDNATLRLTHDKCNLSRKVA